MTPSFFLYNLFHKHTHTKQKKKKQKKRKEKIKRERQTKQPQQHNGRRTGATKKEKTTAGTHTSDIRCRYLIIVAGPPPSLAAGSAHFSAFAVADPGSIVFIFTRGPSFTSLGQTNTAHARAFFFFVVCFVSCSINNFVITRVFNVSG